MTLHAFVEQASRAAEKIFNKRGRLLPMWHYVDREGAEHVMPAPPMPDKDTSAMLMRALFVLEGVTRCIFIDEAWIVDSTVSPDLGMEAAIRAAKKQGLANHPARQEIVMFAAEDRSEGMLLARRMIERPAGRKPHLGPLIVVSGMGHMEGRFVGMLPPQPGQRVQ